MRLENLHFLTSSRLTLPWFRDLTLSSEVRGRLVMEISSRSWVVYFFLSVTLGPGTEPEHSRCSVNVGRMHGQVAI